MGDKSSKKKGQKPYISYDYVKLPEGTPPLLLLHHKNTVSGKDAEFWGGISPIFGWHMKLGAAQAANGGFNQQIVRYWMYSHTMSHHFVVYFYKFQIRFTNDIGPLRG